MLLLCSVLVEQSPESREQLAWAVGWNQCIFLAPAFLVPAAAYLLTYIHTYIHTYILTYIHTYLHTYIHTYILTYIHTYILT